jgi:hypothetical protein
MAVTAIEAIPTLVRHRSALKALGYAYIARYGQEAYSVH